MTEYALRWVDAFTDTRFAGNPCAVVFDADDVDEATRIAFTRETRLSECAFLQDSAVADFGARYYVASGEIPMAGHPTIATIAALLDAGLLTLDASGRATCSLEVGAGVLAIRVAASGGAPPLITMRQLAPTFGRTWDAELVAPLVGLDVDDIAAPPETVSTGTPFLITQVRSHEALRRAVLDVEALHAFHAEHATDFFEPFLTAMGGATAAGDVYSRLLLTPPEPPEDPFTGSATGCLGAWLWAHGHIDDPAFVAEQGHDMGRPGRAWVEAVGPRDAIEGVDVTGQGVVLMRGRVDLPGRAGTTSRPRIAGVETGIPAFIGETEQHPEGGPRRITSVAEFARLFGSGGAEGNGEMAIQVRLFFDNGGTSAVIAPCDGSATGHATARGLLGAGRVDLVVLPAGARGGDVAPDVVAATIDWASTHGALVLVDPSRTWTSAADVRSGARPDSPDAVLYFPRVVVPTGDGSTLEVGPSGAVAGMIARTDRERGVWKAPAGLRARLAGVTGLASGFDERATDELAAHGVNVLRSLPGRGIVAWGARTTSSDPEWRFVPVRRTALFIEESLRRGLDWVVFEPNAEPLWSDVGNAATSFVDELFRRGALAGTARDDAWFVRCDATTTTPDDIDRGRLHLEVGFAPLQPAEFVVLRITLRARPPDGH